MEEDVVVGTYGRCENRIQNAVGAFGGKCQLEDLRADEMILME
jgi:hypothetical protein